jgi:Arc/MetJ-type ribon-helix-helix transcriptional regulator
MEEADPVSEPNFDAMTKNEVVAWFRDTRSLAPVMAAMTPSTDPPSSAPPDVPMMLVSIRLPVSLVARLDDLARQDGLRRSELIREALADFAHEHASTVGRDEAERALEVLRRLVATRTAPHVDAA